MTQSSVGLSGEIEFKNVSFKYTDGEDYDSRKHQFQSNNEVKQLHLLERQDAEKVRLLI